jgi:hypothetical protein
MAIDWEEFARRRKREIAVNSVLASLCALLVLRLSAGEEWRMLIQKTRDYQSIQERVERVDVLKRREPSILEQSRIVADELRLAVSDTVAPVDDTLGWATRVLNRCALRAGLETSAIAAVRGRSAPWQSDPLRWQILDPFAAVMEMTATWEQLVALARAVEEDNPFACMVGVTIRAAEAEAGAAPRYRIMVVVEWPMWTDKQESHAIRQLLSSLH